MTKFEQLLNEMCPDGCDYKELGKITFWNKHFQNISIPQTSTNKYKSIPSKLLKDMNLNYGDIKLISTSKNEDGWTTYDLAKNYFFKDEILTLPEGGSPNIKYWNGKFVSSLNLIATNQDASKYNLKFIYYFLKTKSNFLENSYKGSGIKHPNMSEILSLPIPIPPLSVQTRIVEILDKFTELEKELEKRKSQYEHYRAGMFDFSDQECEWKELEQVANICRGDRITKSQLLDDGEYFVISGGTKPMGKYNKFNRNENTITISQYGVAGFVSYQLNKFWANDVCYSLFPKEILINKFLYYFLISKQKNIYELTTKAIPDCLPISNLKSILIPIPPLSVQTRIVEILDKFSALIDSANQGIPKEIELRKKQYEYYLNKLLTFKEKQND